MRHFSYELDMTSNSTWNLITTTTEAKESFLYLQETGHFIANHKYYTTREALDSFLIKLTVSGQGVLEYNGKTKSIGPGHFFWIDCMNHQKYYTDPAVGHWDVIWIHFNGPTARAYYDAFLRLGNGNISGELADTSSLSALLSSLLNPSSTPDYPFDTEQNLFELDVHTSGILTQVLIECISSTGISGKVHHIPPIVCKIRSYLVANYNNKITLNHLAAHFNLDPYYLQKLFKRSLGQSPIEYIIHLRMNKAKNLIRTSDLSISEIAYAVGVDNISHFSRQFKKLEGMTPVEYRRNWRSQN
jgi:AraC-like DNA-binding protein